MHLLRRFGSPIKSMVQRRAAAASAEQGGAPGGPPASPLGRPAGGAAAQSGAAQSNGAAATAGTVAVDAGAGRQPEVDEAGQLAASPLSRRIISRPDIMVPPGRPPFLHRHHEYCSH
jgi:hypothetical protein